MEDEEQREKPGCEDSKVMNHIIGAACLLSEADEADSTFDVYIVNQGKVNGYELKHISEETPAGISSLRPGRRRVPPHEFYSRRRAVPELQQHPANVPDKERSRPIVLEISEISENYSQDPMCTEMLDDLEMSDDLDMSLMGNVLDMDLGIQKGPRTASADMPVSLVGLKDFVEGMNGVDVVDLGRLGSSREAETMRNVIDAIQMQISSNGSIIEHRVGLNDRRVRDTARESLAEELSAALVAAFVPPLDEQSIREYAQDAGDGDSVQPEIMQIAGETLAESSTIVFVEAGEESSSLRRNRVGGLVRFFEDLERGK